MTGLAIPDGSPCRVNGVCLVTERELEQCAWLLAATVGTTPAVKLRACLFGLLVAFHRNKQGKRAKRTGFALGFSKATVGNRHARESTY
jgi:hypothetical protein